MLLRPPAPAPRARLTRRPRPPAPRASARPPPPPPSPAASPPPPPPNGPASEATTTSSSTRPPPGAWRWDESSDAVKSYAVLLAVLAAGPPAAAVGGWTCLPYFVSLAATTIYIGAHRGLTSRARAPLSLKESALLPFAAAGSLGVAYVVLTYGKLDLTALLAAYFFVLSSVAITAAAAPPLRRLGGGATAPAFDVAVPPGWLVDADGEALTSLSVAPTDVAAAVLGVGVAAADAASHHQNFTLSNLCAAAVCADVLRLLGLRSFRAAGAALVGLALYDVIAVFFTSGITGGGDHGGSVMVAVATSDAFAGPTRLLFPRGAAAAAGATDVDSFPFSLLGLGDVAVPGLLAALALRFDASRAVDMSARAAAAAAAIDGVMASGLPSTASDREVADAVADAADAAFEGVAAAEQAARDAAVGGAPAAAAAAPTAASLASRPYFTAVMAAYAVGLAAAFAANAATGVGQPALIYLVPATLGGAAALAAARGDVARLAAFTDTAPSILNAKGPAVRE